MVFFSVLQHSYKNLDRNNIILDITNIDTDYENITRYEIGRTSGGGGQTSSGITYIDDFILNGTYINGVVPMDYYIYPNDFSFLLILSFNESDFSLYFPEFASNVKSQ